MAKTSTKVTSRAPVNRAAVTVDSGLHLRRGPGLDSKGILPKGTEVTVLDDRIPAELSMEDWAPVVTDDGVYGWAAREYLRPLEG